MKQEVLHLEFVSLLRVLAVKHLRELCDLDLSAVVSLLLAKLLPMRYLLDILDYMILRLDLLGLELLEKF